MAYKTEDLLSQDRNGQTKPKPNPTRRRKHKPAPESHSDQMIDIMNKEREDAHKT